MPFVAIVGTGDLGGALAHKLASRDRLGEIRLIDPAGGVAAGKALDIQQAGPVEAFRARVTASADIASAAGASVIVLADTVGSPGSEIGGEAGLALVKRLAQFDDRAIFVFAGASQRPLLEQSARELKIARRRLVGSAPAALVSAISALVALEIGGSALDVSLLVLGMPPNGTVVAWSEATIAGQTVTRFLTPAQLLRLAARVPRLWPPGPYALASAAARVTEAVATESRRRFDCFAVLDGELGARQRATAVPVRVGANGIERIDPPSLSAQERVQLENALESV